MKIARRSTLLGLFLAAAVALLLAQSALAQAPEGKPQLDLPRISVGAGMHRLNVQVASTPLERQIGLMYRSDMPDHEGMLFVFPQPAVQCFWMMNTLIPLTAAFLADDGHIVNLADMEPLTTDSHCSEAPVRYVLETRQGWFSARGIGTGQTLRADLFAQP